jgi:hypothetical protein
LAKRSASLGFLGALFDLAQSLLRLRHRPLLRLALLLEALLRRLQSCSSGSRRGDR